MNKEEYRKAFFAGRNYYHDLITDETKDSTISAFDKWYTNVVLLQGAVRWRSEQLADYLQDVIGKKYSIYFEQQDIDGLIEAANCH